MIRMIFFVIGIMIIGVCGAIFSGVVKYKVFKEVFDGSLKKYTETKVVERQFQMNRAKDMKETKK